MRILKRYSANYQVIELEQEVDVEDGVELTGVLLEMEEIAKEELKRMIDVSNEVSTVKPATQVSSLPQSSKPSFTQSNYGRANTDTRPASIKQLDIIKKNFDKAKAFASELGIPLNSDLDLQNLTLQDAKVLVGKIFAK